MGLLTVRCLLSVSVAFLFLRTVDANCNSEESLLCEPSAYSVYPQDVYRIEGQQLNITCQHPNISNNPVFQTDGVDLMCGDEDNPNCVIDVSQGRLRFDPINADNLDVTYVCVHQVSFTCFCSASFTIFRGGIPTISDSQLQRSLDFDSGALTLSPTINHGAPAAIVNWYRNGQLINSGVDTLRIPSMGAIQAADRGIYFASINNTFGGQTVNYTIIVNNFPPIITCQTTSTPSLLTIFCEIISYPTITTDDITWQRTYQGIPTPVGGAISFTGDMNEVDYRATSKITISRSECLRDTLYRISVKTQASVDATPCNPIPVVENLVAQRGLTQTSMTIRWTNPTTVPGSITGYVIEYRLQSSPQSPDWESVPINNGPANMHTIDGLIQGRNYQYRVQIFVNNIGQRVSDIHLYEPEKIPSHPPLNVDASKRASVADVDVIVVKWKAVPAVNYNITGYIVTYRTSQGKNDAMVPANKLNLTITDAMKAETYYICVQAYNSLGLGPKSPEVMSQPLSAEPATVPITVIITSLDISRSFVNVIWMIKPASVTVTSVRLNISRIDVISNRRIQINSSDVTNNSQSSQCLSSLNSSTVYEFCVVVTTADGDQHAACERANTGTNDNFNHDTSNCASVAAPVTTLVIEPWIIAIIVVTAILLVVVVFGGCGLILGVKKNKKSVDMENPYSTTEGALSDVNGYPMRSASPPTSSCLSSNRNQHQMQWQGDYPYNNSGFSSPGFSPGYNSPGPVSAV